LRLRPFVASAAVALVALGGAAHAQAPDDRLRAAPGATLAVGSARIEGSVVLNPESATPQTLTIAGALTIDGRNGASTVDLTALLARVGVLESILVDGVTFIDFPSLVRAAFLDVEDLPRRLQAKRWVRVDPEDLANAGVQTSSASDPSAQFAILRAMGDIVDVGAEDVRGEPTTHLQGTVRIKRALRKASKADRERLEAALAQFEREPFTVDVWLDAQNRIRRFAMQVTAAANATPVAVSVDFFEFGTPIDVVAPQPSEVVSFTKFQDAIQQALRS
jgi:hypothetical protein